MGEIVEVIYEDGVLKPLKLHSRAADAYYISTAMIAGGVLLTNDKKMAANIQRHGLGAYYIPEEPDEFFKLLEVSP